MSRKVTVPETVDSSVVQGRAVLVDLESGTSVELDEVGTRMWQLLAEHGTLATVADTMAAEFDVDPARLEKDLALFVDRLEQRGLLLSGADDA